MITYTAGVGWGEEPHAIDDANQPENLLRELCYIRDQATEHAGWFDLSVYTRNDGVDTIVLFEDGARCDFILMRRRADYFAFLCVLPTLCDAAARLGAEPPTRTEPR